MKPVVFSGPTIAPDEVRREFDVDARPPAALGDIYRAVHDGHTVIGLIDGYFERVPAPWHKEILWALSEGAMVMGAASIGALRACELDAFGMIGVGAIYRAFASGVLEDDDEVAVAHAAGGDFRASSEAMVNIRATLESAHAEGIVSASARSALLAHAKARFYPERTWADVLVAEGPADRERDALAEWLPSGRIDAKRDDAVAMLDAIADANARRRVPSSLRPGFVRTSFWEAARMEFETMAAAGGAEAPRSRIADELVLRADDYLRLRHRARSRMGILPTRDAARRTVLDLLEQTGGHEAVVERASRKTAALRDAGWDEATLADLGLDRDALARWWFEERQARPVPPDLAAYAARLDLGLVSYLRVLRQEFAFRALTPPPS